MHAIINVNLYRKSFVFWNPHCTIVDSIFMTTNQNTENKNDESLCMVPK